MHLRMMMSLALILLASACTQTGNSAFENAQLNSWPLESIGHSESTRTHIEIAAIVHRGGLREDRDELAKQVTVDRLLRYAAKLASERKQPRFSIEADLLTFRHAGRVKMGGIPVFSVDKMYFWYRAIMMFPDAATPVSSGRAVFETNAVMAAPKEPLLTLPPTALH